MVPLKLAFSSKSKFLLLFLFLAYISTRFYLYTHQRQLILRPTLELPTFPDDARFNIPYEHIKVPVAGQYLHGWWIPAPLKNDLLNSLPGKPVRILELFN